MNPITLTKIVQHLVREVPYDNNFKTEYGKYLAFSRVTHGQFLDALEFEMDKPHEMLGLSNEELVELMKRLNNPRNIRKLVYKKLSPNDKEKYPELGEGAPGTSFTSTANVAKYPVPIGNTPLRRQFWKKKKKKK